MIKVLRVIHSLNPIVGGPPEGIIQASPILSKYGIETTVICLDDPKSKWLYNAPFKVIALGKGFLKYGFQFGLVSKISNIASNYDLIIIHGLWQYHSLATFLALRKLKRKYFVYTHGMLDPWFQRKYPIKHLKKKLYWNLFESRIIKRSEAVFFTSKKEELVSREWFKNLDVKKEIINYGIANPPQEEEKLRKTFIKKFPILHDKKIILFLSRIDHKKGIDLLIEAFGKIHENHPKLFLVIAGPYHKSNKLVLKLKKFIKKYNFENKVIFTGMLEGDMKWGAYYSSDFYCLPSHSENFGIVVAEALGCGGLIGISNKVNIYEEIENAKAGLIFNDTKDATVKVLKEWLKLNKEEKLTIRRNARLLFEKKYNVLNNTNKFVSKLKYHLEEKI
tara:strand:- start:4064 stop:5236 length:1173 start_codon:yes stop_codon:yes gene_type:complete